MNHPTSSGLFIRTDTIPINAPPAWQIDTLYQLDSIALLKLTDHNNQGLHQPTGLLRMNNVLSISNYGSCSLLRLVRTMTECCILVFFSILWFAPKTYN